MKNRLQFRHHSEIFETREQAIEYIYTSIRRATEPSMAAEDDSYGFSLLAEPTILRYKNEENEEDPHIILAIGSATNEGVQYADNQFCIIDIDKTESEIQDLWEELEKVVKSLTLVTRDTNTLKLHAEKTDDGTILSGDVAVAEAHIFDNMRLPNRLMVTEDGLYTYVNLTYDEERETFTFVVTNAETGELEKTSVKLENNYLVSGFYSVEDESLHLVMKDGNEVVIDLEQLIDEWDVEGEASKTPIVLTKEEVGYGDDNGHSHVEPWQDVLRADVRLADMAHNILKKTSDGRYLYVRGMADNIAYFKDGVEMSVADALNECARKKVSSDNSNIIYEKPDGIFATASLKYISNENTLVFTASNVTGGTTTETIKLNTVELFKAVYYDSVKEELVILYVNDTGDTVEVRIPIGEWMSEWEWDIDNEGHNVKLHKERVIAGNDKVSADAAIYDDPDNILVDKNHELFVKGTADNIKYGRNSTVEEELDKLIASDADINSRLDETSGKVDSVRADLDAEIARSTSEDERIENKLDEEITRSTEKDTEHDREINTIETTIGSGFTTDGHETVTYKFNELSAKTDTISAKTETVAANLSILSAQTEAEIARATAEEQRIEKKFDDALGEGFDIRNTVRDEFDREKAEREAADNFLSGAIDTLSASTEGKLVDVVNLDHSIDVDKTDPVRPVVSVNISDEIEDAKPNIIKLNSDGIYAGVDLIYEFNEETGSNQLIFKTTNGTKVYDLKTNSVVDKIYYDPIREAIIIEYTVNGHRMPDVVIPVSALIDEWRVSESTDGAIKLSKIRESGYTQDVLYAESIISDHYDNMLINDNGALYVSSAKIDRLREDLDAEIERAQEAEAGLNDKINEEIVRATSEESRIEGKLDQEIARSTEKDTELENAIATERTERISADTEIMTYIDSAITEERTARESADTALEVAISNERNDRIASDAEIRSDFNEALATERSQREAADIALQTAIDNEAIYRANADTELRNYIDSAITAEATARENADHLLEDAINTEKDARIDADTELRNYINSAITEEKTARESADTEIRTYIDSAITAEATARENADHLLQDAIDNEALIRESADTAILTALEAEIARSTAADAAHDTAINTNASDIANEVIRATNAENALSQAISAERDRATTAENALQTAINNEINARQSADDALQSNIDNEALMRENADTLLQTAIDNETARAIREDEILLNRLEAEITRSTDKDAELEGKINDEVANRQAGDIELRSLISDETIRANNAENELRTDLATEIQRSTDKDAELEAAIAAEAAAREAADDALQDAIDAATHSLDSTTTIRVDKTNPAVWKAHVITSSGDKNIVIADETNGGIYATAELVYDAATNTIKLMGTNGMLLSQQKLGAGSLLDSIHYDPTEKNLVINYHNADGEAQELQFGVAELFNEWEVKNPSEGSALELTKVPNTGETGAVDYLYGRVLLTKAVEIGGGEVEYGDNIIRIVNNGLYASGSAITEAKEAAECATHELKQVEKATFGHQVDQECGSGFTYTAKATACYISAATSMYEADEILDRALCTLSAESQDASEEVECLKKALTVTQQNVMGITVPECGMNADQTIYKYEPHPNACVISAATSMDNADALLDSAICDINSEIEDVKEDLECVSAETKSLERALGVVGNCAETILYPKTQGCILSAATTYADADALLETAVCELLRMMVGSETPSASLVVEHEGANQYFAVNVRLSHGNTKAMTDEELVITDMSGDTIETGYNEFTDTNVLRIIALDEYIPETQYNGLYLSNDWDCGQYTENGVGTPGEKYKTDDTASAQNIFNQKFRNGVRYTNA
jgi:hypothetical protein